MTDILQIVKNHLQSTIPESFVVKIGFMPDSPINVIALYLLEGDNQTTYFRGTPTHVQRPRFRARVRAKDYTTAYNCAVQVKEALCSFIYQDFLGTFLEGDIVPLGQDDEKRPEFEVKFRALLNE